MPARYTHTSVALHDAIAGTVGASVVEVHLSNTHAREAVPASFTPIVSPVAKGVVMGFGARSYELALDALLPSIVQQNWSMHESKRCPNAQHLDGQRRTRRRAEAMTNAIDASGTSSVRSMPALVRTELVESLAGQRQATLA